MILYFFPITMITRTTLNTCKTVSEYFYSGVFFYFTGQTHLNMFFSLVDEGRENPNTTKSGYHRHASETPFKWRFAGGPMIT